MADGKGKLPPARLDGTGATLGVAAASNQKVWLWDGGTKVALVVW
jgi:hypothetical protein